MKTTSKAIKSVALEVPPLFAVTIILRDIQQQKWLCLLLRVEDNTYKEWGLAFYMIRWFPTDAIFNPIPQSRHTCSTFCTPIEAMDNSVSWELMVACSRRSRLLQAWVSYRTSNQHCILLDWCWILVCLQLPPTWLSLPSCRSYLWLSRLTDTAIRN